MKALYKISESDPQPANQGNAGLWYDKYCNQWHVVDDHWSLRSYEQNKQHFNPKQNWIKRMTGSAVGDSGQLLEACKRLRSLCRKLEPGADVQFFSTGWRFVTGLGREHPVENGFAWHQTLGVPYLPGSSIKGMVRAYVGQWLETDAINEDEIERIFGPREQTNAAVGSVVFFDALPVEPVQLEADIMTPHYAPYYESGEVPGDWYDPIPIPFLTVASGQTFQFAVSPRDQQYVADCNKVREWLRAALEWIGAGAKTAVGYGRMVQATSLPDGMEETAEMRDAEQDKVQNWLDETIKGLRNNKDFDGHPDEDLWKNALAQEWKKASKDIKQPALVLIKQKWKELGIDWNNPKKSAKKAKQIFEAG